MQRSDAIVPVDSDHESVASVNTIEEEALLRSPGEAAKAIRRPRAEPNKEGLKAKSRYKAAIKLCARLGDRNDLSKEEKDRLVWAKEEIEKGQAFFAGKRWCEPSDSKFANRIEEDMACKRQRSTESEGSSGKRQKRKDEAVPQHKTATKRTKADTTKRPEASTFKAATTTKKTKASDPKEQEASTSKLTMAGIVAKRRLIVALIDRSDPQGQMVETRWKIVEMKLLDAMFAKMSAEPEAPMPSFDGAGWFNGVKLLKCKDDSTLNWLREAAKTLQGLWEGASLEVVDRKDIPSLPKAKVLIPRVVKPEDALRLLQRQNPDVPTSDWKVLKVLKPAKEGEGQNYILLINKMAEDILYSRYGKMSWGVGSVYLRLKKRHPTDRNSNTLAAEEIEEDLGIEEILSSSLNLREGEEPGVMSAETNPGEESEAHAKDSTNKPPPK
ncbi:uncharacterized protein LOC119687356 [Teleopsis dalmanni]|uniref:uncharacterized protein LOC119687356 n=1 Tax=Teleopsis dalmanni TaxID=139649 RepID=UPI0018CF763F|nr:uncharacterized protein LOC119687356 [Teleopsis dalmanni]